MTRLRWLISGTALVAFACGTPSESDRPSFSVSRIQIDSVTIRSAGSVPVLEQDRSGRVITLEIRRQRLENVPCLQLAKLFDQQVRLPGEFAPGDYALQLNGRAYPFGVD